MIGACEGKWTAPMRGYAFDLHCYYTPRPGCKPPESSNPMCQMDPLLEGVLQRVAHLTGASRDNIGDAQILKYGEDPQRLRLYESHHDQIKYQARPAVPEGVRVIWLLGDSYLTFLSPDLVLVASATPLA